MTPREPMQFTFLACADLKAIWDALSMPSDVWGSGFSQKLAAAREFAAGFTRHCEALAGNPEIGVQRDELQHGIRSSPFGRHIVYYRVRGEAVEVLRVLRDNGP